MAEAVLGTHDDWQIGKTKIFLKVSTACDPGCELPVTGALGGCLEKLQHQMGSALGFWVLSPRSL